MKYEIKDPCCITSRLMAGIKIGDGYISIEPYKPTDDGRMRYHYYIDTEKFEYGGKDLRSGVGGGDGLQGMLAALLDFLGACAESRRYSRGKEDKSENYGLFPENVGEWAEQNSDEIDMAAEELREKKGIIKEV